RAASASGLSSASCARPLANRSCLTPQAARALGREPAATVKTWKPSDHAKTLRRGAIEGGKPRRPPKVASPAPYGTPRAPSPWIQRGPQGAGHASSEHNLV